MPARGTMEWVARTGSGDASGWVCGCGWAGSVRWWWLLVSGVQGPTGPTGHRDTTQICSVYLWWVGCPAEVVPLTNWGGLTIYHCVNVPMPSLPLGARWLGALTPSSKTLDMGRNGPSTPHIILKCVWPILLRVQRHQQNIRRAYWEEGGEGGASYSGSQLPPCCCVRHWHRGCTGDGGLIQRAEKARSEEWRAFTTKVCLRTPGTLKRSWRLVRPCSSCS